MIFVFGSNMAGRHGRGAAQAARFHWGAEYGVGVGRTGDAYAIPTKDANFRTMGLLEIRWYVREFIMYAWFHPELAFKLTRVGCGLAGYKDLDMIPLFEGIPRNVLVPPGWGHWFPRNREWKDKR